MTIPADIRVAETAGRIPHGTSSLYLAQSRDKSAIVGILFMVCFTSIFIILRLCGSTTRTLVYSMLLNAITTAPKLVMYSWLRG